MPNLVYYKDKGGVVSGPFKEEEAMALLKANFFGPDHVFRIVDAYSCEEFTSIGDLRSLNGAETPFKSVRSKTEEVDDSKELIRVYKEFATVLHQRNKERVAMKQQLDAANAKALKYDYMKERIIDNFKRVMKDEHPFSIKTVEIRSRKPKRELSLFVPKRTSFYNNSSTSVRFMAGNSWNPAMTDVVEAHGSVEFSLDMPYIYIAPHISYDPSDGSEHMPKCIYPKRDLGVVCNDVEANNSKQSASLGNASNPDAVYQQQKEYLQEHPHLQLGRGGLSQRELKRRAQNDSEERSVATQYFAAASAVPVNKRRREVKEQSEIPANSEDSEPRVLRDEQGVRWFVCPFAPCYYRKEVKRQIRQHIRATHTFVFPFVCRQCGKRFTSDGNRKTHEKGHKSLEEREIYKCLFPGCNSSYTENKKLNKHCLVEHKVPYSKFEQCLFGCLIYSYFEKYMNEHYQKKHNYTVVYESELAILG